MSAAAATEHVGSPWSGTPATILVGMRQDIPEATCRFSYRLRSCLWRVRVQAEHVEGIV
jgi:hypothetical protein